MVDGAALEKRWAGFASWVRIPPSPPIWRSSYPSTSYLARETLYHGEVLEWPIRRAWRARVAFGDRGFESHPLRHPGGYTPCPNG